GRRDRAGRTGELGRPFGPRRQVDASGAGRAAARARPQHAPRAAIGRGLRLCLDDRRPGRAARNRARLLVSHHGNRRAVDVDRQAHHAHSRGRREPHARRSVPVARAQRQRGGGGRRQRGQAARRAKPVKRRAVLQVALSGAWLALGCAREREQAAARSGKQRLVSLSPAITETLFAIGAGPELVGVSDYCNFPEQAKKLPRTGTALTPGYEAIVRLKPSLILTEGANSAPRRELTALGVTKFLPWHSLEDIVASTRLLGALTAHADAASELARKLWDGLAVAEAPNGPRVLVVLGESSG